MDKKKGLLNIIVAMVFRVGILVCSLFARRLLIRNVGDVANGLDSLYGSIIGFLSVAELGIGSAITFCMYKPIVEGDKYKVNALYILFKKLYIIIGFIILVAGCALLPALPVFAKGYSNSTFDLYYTFALMLVSVVLTYAFSAKIALFNAYKDNYISTAIQSGCYILQYVLQIVVLVVFKSFAIYIWCRIVAVIIQWVITDIISLKKYSAVMLGKHALDNEAKRQVVKNIKAMFMHKIGGVLVNTADSIIISTFIGVVVLGKYSNYTTIVTAMNNTIMLFFTPLTSVVGHMLIEETRDQVQHYYKIIYYFNYIIGCVFYLGYYAVIDNIVSICFGSGVKMSKAVSFIITLNYFIQFTRASTGLFRDASGTFYNDRWKPLFEGLVNIVLSIAFVFLFEYLFGADFAVVGVIVATIITNLTICHVVEPYVLYKYAFHTSPKKYYLKNYTFIFVFCVLLFALNATMVTHSNEFIEMIINGSISLAYSLVLTVILMITNKGARQYVGSILQKLRRKRKVDNIDNVDKIENFNSPD